MNLLHLPASALRLQLRLLRLPLTTYEVLTHRDEPARSSSDVARKSLVAELLGRGKQIAGIVLGSDELLTEGRLEQAKADEQREAATNATIADAKRRRAEAEFSDQQRVLDEQREQTEREAAAHKARLEAERLDRKRAADEVAEQRKQAAARAAEQRKAKAAAKQLRAESERAADLQAAQRRERAAQEALAKAETLRKARTGA